MAEAPVTRDQVEWGEVQRLVLRGYLKLPWAHFLYLRITNGSRPAPWVHGVLDEGSLAFGWGEKHLDGPAVGIAFTCDGLRALGLDDQTLEGFSPEFVEGLVTPARSRKFHDTGASDPSRWLWGAGKNPVHIVLAVYAKSEADLATAMERHQTRASEAGLVEVRGPDGEALGAARPLDDRREHFGFADGISQPRFRDEPVGLRSGAREADRLAAGEFLLGYPNEADIYQRSPVLSEPARRRGRLSRQDHDFGKNGSYLVVRQLEQDVAAFWRAMSLAGSDSTVADRVALASKMIGRWPDGVPLVARGTPDGPRPRHAEDFDFAHDDPLGHKCPFGAHIRRANPRATLATDPDMGLAKSKKHRILRRGRSYGEPFVDRMVPEELIRAAEAGEGHPGPRGLHFLCFNADIANQFEFVQQTWLNGSVFQGLHGEVDPLMGDPADTGGLFTVPGEPLRRRVTGVPRFVTVRGGAYFFAPSQAGLHYLSRLK